MCAPPPQQPKQLGKQAGKQAKQASKASKQASGRARQGKARQGKARQSKQSKQSKETSKQPTNQPASQPTSQPTTHERLLKTGGCHWHWAEWRGSCRWGQCISPRPRCILLNQLEKPLSSQAGLASLNQVPGIHKCTSVEVKMKIRRSSTEVLRVRSKTRVAYVIPNMSKAWSISYNVSSDKPLSFGRVKRG